MQVNSCAGVCQICGWQSHSQCSMHYARFQMCKGLLALQLAIASWTFRLASEPTPRLIDLEVNCSIGIRTPRCSKAKSMAISLTVILRAPAHCVLDLFIHASTSARCKYTCTKLLHVCSMQHILCQHGMMLCRPRFLPIQVCLCKLVGVHAILQMKSSTACTLLAILWHRSRAI